MTKHTQAPQQIWPIQEVPPQGKGHESTFGGQKDQSFASQSSQSKQNHNDYGSEVSSSYMKRAKLLYGDKLFH